MKEPLTRFVRSIVLSLFVLASPFLPTPNPTFAQTITGSAPAGQMPGVTITHGTEVRPVSIDIDLSRTPAPANPEAKKVFRAPLGSGTTALKSPLATPSAHEIPVPQLSQTITMPAPIVSFKGLDFTNWGAGWPPDTVGDVGINYFIQAVNTSFGIFSKTGTRLGGSTFDTLWSKANTGTPCDANNQGDVTVIYDPMADRWILGDFGFGTDAFSNPIRPFYECIAVSKTGNPVTGGWYLYPLRADDDAHPWFNDYPKMGIWPDGLYMTANMFDSSDTFREVRVWALNRSDLESGATLRNVVVDTGSATYFSLLPSNLRGALPPTGRDNLLVSESQTGNNFQVFKFHVDYSGSGSTFTGPTNVSQTSYSPTANTVPTPGNPLDTIGDRLMMQAQYRNLNGKESLWINHSVQTSATGPTGIQWAQIDVTAGNVITTPVQQQVYGNLGDGVSRWLGSLAVDDQGNMALGYSAASATVNPDIRYAGRLASDPLNTLPQIETTMLPGVTRATQVGNCGGSTCIRWGDYSGMSLDPDGCTFWYTNEYYEVNGLDWQTRIGSFRFPNCTPTSPLLLNKSANTSAYNHVGQTIQYTYTITNDTETTLAGPFLVNDNKLGTINPCGSGPLATGASTSCTSSHIITQADLDAGTLTNIAVASTVGITPTLTSPQATVTITATQSPALSLGKSASLASYQTLGQVITYTYTLTNGGNVTLAGPFSITDDKLGTINPCGSGPVAPGAHNSCKAGYRVTQADLDKGSIVNTATASTTFHSSPVTSPSAKATVTAQQSGHLSLTRHANPNHFVHAGDVISYTFTATNDGNVTLSTVSISDTLATSLSCTPPQPATRAPGAQLSCSGNYTVLQADLTHGSISDTATAHGTDPNSQPVSGQASGSILYTPFELWLPLIRN